MLKLPSLWLFFNEVWLWKIRVSTICNESYKSNRAFMKPFYDAMRYGEKIILTKDESSCDKDNSHLNGFIKFNNLLLLWWNYVSKFKNV